MSLISPQARDALEHWLETQKSLKGGSENTIKAYSADTADFIGFMTSYKSEPQGLAALARITTRDMRAWMAHERGRDVGARSLARSLSAVKSFPLLPIIGFESQAQTPVLHALLFKLSPTKPNTPLVNYAWQHFELEPSLVVQKT